MKESLKAVIRVILLPIIGLLTTVTLFSSCGTVASLSYGHADEAYILIASHGRLTGRTVAIQIDGGSPHVVKLINGNVADRKGKRIRVRPGRHRVTVLSKNNMRLYESDVYVNAGSTKKIVLK